MNIYNDENVLFPVVGFNDLDWSENGAVVQSLDDENVLFPVIEPNDLDWSEDDECDE